MLPSEPNILGKPSGVLLRNVIATVFDITIIAWSHVQSNRQVSASSSEPEIAGHLGRAMLIEKRQRPKLDQQIRIEEEVGIRSSLVAPKPEGRIDIKIIYSFNENEYFGMECKRISSTNKELATKYVVEGVMRFVTGKYSPGHDWSSMLGFVIDGNITGSIDMIQNHLLVRNLDTQMENNSWALEQSFGTYNNVFRTRHRQYRRNSPMTILHLFLNIN